MICRSRTTTRVLLHREPRQLIKTKAQTSITNQQTDRRSISHSHFVKQSNGYKYKPYTSMVTSSFSFTTSVRSLSSSVRYLCRSPLYVPIIPLNSQLVFERLNGHSVPLRRLVPAVGSGASLSFNRFDCRTKASMAEMTTSADKGEEKKVEVFDTEEELAVSLAKYTAELSAKFSKERGSFSVVLSGGSLIKSLRKLLEPPYIDSIDWSKWHVFWVDERVVPKDHVDSNYKLAFDGFLSQVPILPGNVYAINDALPAEGAADDYETCLKHLVNISVVDSSSVSGFPKFDLMLLGMGPDGHVASLFPGHPLVKENEKWVTFIKDSPKPPPERITFTFPVINSSAYIALVVCGNGEADAVHRALGKGQDADLLPVQMVSPEGELKWFLDKAAASKL